MRCRIKFTSQEFVDVHMKCHIPPHELDTKVVAGTNIVQRFKCHTCNDVRFKSWHECALHLWTSHSEDLDMYVCSFCDSYRTTWLANLENHILTHGDVPKFGCDKCSKKFKQLSQLLNHQTIHEKDAGQPVPNWQSTQVCKECSKPFSSLGALNKHIKYIHKKILAFTCEECGKKFARKESYQTHLSVHSGEKGLKCESCDFATNDRCALTRHKRIHTGDKPYKCSHCDYSSAQAASLRYHIQCRHSQSNDLYKCWGCSFTTVSERKYHSHVCQKEEEETSAPASTPNNNLYTCPHCSYTADGSDAAETHVCQSINKKDDLLTQAIKVIQ